MNDDIERQLRSVNPLGVPPELRARVLSAVGAELNAAPRRRWLRPWPVVAASLLFGLTLNYLASRTVDRRIAAVLGPPIAHRQAAEIAAEIAAVTDSATGHWAYERLVPAPSPRDESRRYAARLRELVRQLTLEPRADADETPPKNPQVGRDLRGSRDRPPAGAQCSLHLALRY